MQSSGSIRERARDYWEIDGIPSVAYGLAWLAIVVPTIELVACVSAIHSEFQKGLAGLLVISWPLLVVFLLIWLSLNLQDLIEKVKLRTTYPRTGYVAPPSYWNNPALSQPSKWMQAIKLILRLFWLCLFLKFLNESKPEAWTFLLLGLSSGSISSIQDHFEGKPSAKLPLAMAKGIGYWLLLYFALAFPQWSLRSALAAIAAMAIALINGRFSRHLVVPAVFLGTSLSLLYFGHNMGGAVLLLLAPGLTLLVDGLLTFSLYVRANPLRSA